jgi:Zn-dependent peptidase ImmA (M78 family)
VIDHNVNGILERILVAHELGHAVLHTKIAMITAFGMPRCSRTR